MFEPLGMIEPTEEHDSSKPNQPRFLLDLHVVVEQLLSWPPAWTAVSQAHDHGL